MLMQQKLSYYMCHVRAEIAWLATLIELFKGYFQSALSLFLLNSSNLSFHYSTQHRHSGIYVCILLIIITKNQTLCLISLIRVYTHLA